MSCQMMHSNVAEDKLLYNEAFITRSLNRIEQIQYHQWVTGTSELSLSSPTVNGIKFTCYNAGHVLGACMFFIDIAGVKV